MPWTSSLRGLRPQACPACGRPLQDAVSGARGHAVCRLCLPARAPMGAQLLCPLYQEEEEETRAAMAPKPLGPLEETCCEEHGEKIYFFCEKDAEMLCVLCKEGPAHQAHKVVFLEEAIQPYRDRLRSRLEAVSTERDKIQGIRFTEDQKVRELLTKIEIHRQAIEAAFERLNQLLGGQRQLLLSRLWELEQEICKEKDEYIATVSEEVFQLGDQVRELEEKCQWPASELLQDVRANQSRCELKKAFVIPETLSSDLIGKIRNFCKKTLVLPEMMKTFSENLMHHLHADSAPGQHPMTVAIAAAGRNTSL